MNEHEEGSPRSGLSAEELGSISAGHCPQCGGRGFVIGPAAHGSITLQLNIECANVACRSRYNVVFRSGEALMGQDLFDGRASPPWPSEPKRPT